jgi:hypothetical protein
MANDLYVRVDSGAVVNYEYYQRVSLFLKVLYKLEIITEKHVIDVAIKFQPLFV